MSRDMFFFLKKTLQNEKQTFQAHFLFVDTYYTLIALSFTLSENVALDPESTQEVDLQDHGQVAQFIEITGHNQPNCDQEQDATLPRLRISCLLRRRILRWWKRLRGGRIWSRLTIDRWPTIASRLWKLLDFFVGERLDVGASSGPDMINLQNMKLMMVSHFRQ